ncbi:MAG: hypothetical protein JXQ83_08190 [Candidatus Glassbacteria bacterium]|nr:hypothetical protein [Candidatus Glassbacteria bacterium]
MLKKTLSGFMLCLALAPPAYGQFGTDTWEWQPLYRYLRLDEAAVERMRGLYARWRAAKPGQGWNKYLLGLIGDSVTNDGPFMSDIGKGSDGWVGKGIHNSPTPELNQLYVDFVDRTIGGDSVLGAAAIRPGRSNPWLLDLESHYPEKGNKIGANIDLDGRVLLQNVLRNRKPMWVTVMFGQNHLSRGRKFGQDRRWWDWMVDSLALEGVMPVMITLNPRDIEGIEAYNDDLRAYADSAHLPLIDWYGAAMNDSIGGCGLKDCTRDGVHPIRLGQGAPYHAGDFSLCSIFAPECSGSVDTAPFALLNLLTLEMLIEMEYRVVEYVDANPPAGVGCDFNGDGRKEINDVIALLLFQRANPGDLRADFNGDGKADITDAVSLLIAWKKGTCPDRG